LTPTSGSAKIIDYDIGSDFSEIRALIGVCPQFNILWEELSPYEHLYIFSVIKNLPSDKIYEEIH